MLVDTVQDSAAAVPDFSLSHPFELTHTQSEACRVQGCTANAHPSLPGTGRGYCNTHFKNVLRNGFPETLVQRARTVLRERALELLAGDADMADIVDAVFAYRTAIRPSERRREPTPGQLEALRATVVAYADCPTGYEYDLRFAELSKALDEAALSVSYFMASKHEETPEAAERRRLYDARRRAMRADALTAEAA